MLQPVPVMSSKIYRTASSSVVPLKAGGFLEVRRADLRGTKIADKKTWVTMTDWLAEVGEPLVSSSVISSTPTLTADVITVNAHAELAGKMRLHKVNTDIATLKHFNSIVEKFKAQCSNPTVLWPHYGMPSYYLVMYKKKATNLEEHIALTGGKDYYTGASSNLFVLDTKGKMRPVFYNQRKGLIGVPQRTSPVFASLVLLTGRTFEELGITPKSYWRKDALGCLTELE
jgi:hypothetical protein